MFITFYGFFHYYIINFTPVIYMRIFFSVMWIDILDSNKNTLKYVYKNDLCIILTLIYATYGD